MHDMNELITKIKRGIELRLKGEDLLKFVGVKLAGIENQIVYRKDK